MEKFIGLLFDRSDNLRVAVSRERNGDSRHKVEKSIPIEIRNYNAFSALDREWIFLDE